MSHHTQQLTQKRGGKKNHIYCKNKPHKTLEENIGENLCDLSLRKETFRHTKHNL